MKISLIIPYFEAADSLIETLNSVQLTKDDEIIVVDDGSVNYPAAAYCPKVVGITPVSLVTLKQNSGITRALIEGIDKISDPTNYIARLDCGDLCTTDRFLIQRQYLDQNPNVSLVGSWVEFFSYGNSHSYVLRTPDSPKDINRYMKINSAIIHPTAMFRAAQYRSLGGYSEDYPAAEDYALFRRMAHNFNAHNVQSVLVRCLTNDGGISDTRRRRQILSRTKVMREDFDWSLLAIYGIVRAILQLLTPRRLTTWVRSKLDGRS